LNAFASSCSSANSSKIAVHLAGSSKQTAQRLSKSNGALRTPPSRISGLTLLVAAGEVVYFVFAE
jgi:hypothetical protein